MDELEVLKKQWQSREQEFPQLSYDDIYSMILKKSSSIVKWIFFISIGEIILWTLLSFFAPESSKEFTREMGIRDFMLVTTIIGHAIVIVFIVLFYKNYRSIKVTNTVKELMENILRTRKTVRYFVYYNIGMTVLMLIGLNVFLYFNQEELLTLLNHTEGYEQLPAEQILTVFFVLQFVFGLLLIGLLLLFYRIIYGILLRRLKKNYRELKKIEV